MERIKKAFFNSIEGILEAYHSERAFREDIFIVAIFSPLALITNTTGAEKAVLIMSLMLILICELANTAIETIVNRISLEKHPLSKKAKDIGSSLVMLSLSNALLVWALILF